MSFLKKKKRQEKNNEQDSQNNQSVSENNIAASLNESAADAEKLIRENDILSKKAQKRKNNELKKQSSKLAAKTAQQYIGYNQMIEDGICHIEDEFWSKTISFSDINYQTARQDEQVSVFAYYMELLNYIDTSMTLQINICNRRVKGEEFKERVFFAEADDELNVYRKEYNQILAEKALEAERHVDRNRYATFTVKAGDYESAVSKLARIQEDLVGSFRGIGCEVEVLEGKDRLTLLNSFLNPNDVFDFDYKMLLESNLKTKDYITPASFDFTPKSTYQSGDILGQTLFIKDYPATMSDKFISALSDLPIDMNISIHIKRVEQEEALELVKKKISFMNQQKTEEQKKNFESGLSTLDVFNFELKHSIEEAEELLDDLQSKNQAMFKVCITINTFASDAMTLQDNISQITKTGSKYSTKIIALDYQQKEGLNSTLPLGMNHLPIERTMTTASTAIFIPFTTQELYQEGGIYYGQNVLSRNFIYANRYNLNSPNGVYLGKPGSGKSFAAKREMISVLMRDPNAEVLIVDPEREYTSIANGFGGEVVRISATSDIHLNPFDLPVGNASQDDQIRDKSEFILSLCETVMGGRFGLTQAQKSVLDRAVHDTYMQYFAQDSANRVTPTFKDFFKILKQQPEIAENEFFDTEMRNLEKGLEIFVDGSLNVFADQTNVDIQNRFVVYDIHDLGKQLLNMGMLIVLDQLWNRVIQNREKGIHTWLYIDEFQLLLTNEYSANYFFEIYTRSRKYGAVPSCITQNVETLLLNNDARRMLSNSDFVMMFNQSANDKEQLKELLQISEKQLSYVTNSQAGHGLMFFGKTILPFGDKFPHDSKLYRMMTTKLEEVAEIKEENRQADELAERIARNKEELAAQAAKQNSDTNDDDDDDDIEIWFPAKNPREQKPQFYDIADTFYHDGSGEFPKVEEAASEENDDTLHCMVCGAVLNGDEEICSECSSPVVPMPLEEEGSTEDNAVNESAIPSVRPDISGKISLADIKKQVGKQSESKQQDAVQEVSLKDFLKKRKEN